MGLGETAIGDLREGEMSSPVVYIINTGAGSVGGGLLGGGLSPVQFFGRRAAPYARRAMPEWLQRTLTRGGPGEGEAFVVEAAETFEETVQRMLRQADDLEPGADIITQEQTVRALAQGIYDRTPFLRRLVELRNLEGQELDLALQQLIVDFEQLSGVRVEFVDPGAVQAATGTPNNFASLGSRPGWLQIERQLLNDSDLLRRELIHEINAYVIYQWFGGYGASLPRFLTGYEHVGMTGYLTRALDELIEALARGR